MSATDTMDPDLTAQIRSAMPFADVNDWGAVVATPERVVTRGRWQPQYCGTGGVLHGGYLMAMAVAALVLSLGALAGSWTMLAAEGKLWSPASHVRLIGWSLSFIFVAMPVMAVSVVPSHHPDQLVDPVGLAHWLDHLDPETAAVPEWALP